MSWQDLMAKKKHLLGDGAMGTMLQQAGLEIGAAPESMNIEQPEVVKIHLAYLEAGSDIIQTNSFGGSAKLSCYGLADQMEAFNMAAAKLAKEVFTRPEEKPLWQAHITDRRAYAPLEPLSPKRLKRLLPSGSGTGPGGADLILVETMTDLLRQSSPLWRLRTG